MTRTEDLLKIIRIMKDGDKHTSKAISDRTGLNVSRVAGLLQMMRNAYAAVENPNPEARYPEKERPLYWRLVKIPPFLRRLM